MKELPKIYEPKEYEDKIYEAWEKAGLFQPKADPPRGGNSDNLKDHPSPSLPTGQAGLKQGGENIVEVKSFCIAMPPPNVTGTLHMGHAAMLAIEDILTRFHRMKGDRTLWVPGTDHAAIATQTKVEKIIKAEGSDRHQLGREKFLERVRQFAQESHDTIVNQCKKIGSSCDWSREAYTLDEVRTKAVRSVFKLMYDDGLIYRGDRIVNWCPRCHSTLADDEVEYKEQQNAKFYTFRYSQDFPFAISTTRPETKLGDTAVAVNPKDERYKDYIGQTFAVDFCGVPLKIKIIGDYTVDQAFGTGALGVTPAHSVADWQMAESNNLEIVKVIDEDGKIHTGFGEYSGLTAKEARQKIVDKLKENSLIEKEEEINNKLSICYRCSTPIEPLPSLQWFIDVNKKIKKFGKSIKEISIETVKTGFKGDGNKKINIFPERFEKNYFHWMDNLRDWCISRQILFGHQIPVWHKNIPAFSDLKQILEGKKEIKAGEEGSPVKEKVAQEFRYIIESEDDFLWVENNVDFTETFVYTDFFDKENRTRVEGGNFTVTPKKTKIQGVIAKIAKVGKHQEYSVCFEERLTAGYARYEIEFKGFKPEYFKDKTEISSTDLLDWQKLDQPIVSSFVGVNGPYLKDGWEQDTDTLDTWFSSGLWTFSTLANSPDQIKIENGKLVIDSDDFRNFHPTSVMETGYDILFFWVARMIIMTTYAVEDIPFHDVYLHGLVRDDKGKKMSKSLGNVIDPLDMIAKYGTDATRMSLISGTTPGNDMNLSEEKIAGFRNFTNKLWNMSRFVITNYELRITNYELDDRNSTFSDKWIFGKLNNLINEVTSDLDNYRFSQAGERLREFTWNDLADWYLEIAKFEKDGEKENILNYVLVNLLKLWHPLMPFVTEAIWQEAFGADKAIMIEKWPSSVIVNDDEGGNFGMIKEIITSIRNARAENKVEPAKKIKAVIYAGKQTDLIKSQEILIKSLKTGIEELEIKEGGEKLADAIHITVGEIEIFLLGAIDKAKEAERIQKEIDNLEKMISIIKNKLDNQEFTSHAPEVVVSKEKEKLAGFEEELNKLKK